MALKPSATINMLSRYLANRRQQKAVADVVGNRTQLHNLLCMLAHTRITVVSFLHDKLRYIGIISTS